MRCTVLSYLHLDQPCPSAVLDACDPRLTSVPRRRDPSRIDHDLVDFRHRERRPSEVSCRIGDEPPASHDYCQRPARGVTPGAPYGKAMSALPGVLELRSAKSPVVDL